MKRRRKPTTAAVAYAWWHAALRGEKPPITSEVQSGLFKRKLIKDGPWVASRIYLSAPHVCDETGDLLGDEVFVCETNGKIRDAAEEWMYLASNPVTVQEYRYLTSLSSYAETSAPDEPIANPRQPMNRLTTPIPTFAKRKRAK